MWLLNLKKLFFAALLFCLCLPQVFSHEVYLTESEFQELLNNISISKTKSETQTKLIADLKKVLAAQEAELRQALTSLEQSETDSTELKESLSRIQTCSDKLNEYCLKLEQENKTLKVGLGISSGAAGAFLIVLLILLL